MEKIIPDIDEYADVELLSAWDYLETLELTPYVERKMEEIRAEIEKRGI